jgi:membrane protein
VRSLFGIIRTAFGDFFEDQCPRMAAALSYYTVFSLPPLLILMLLLLGLVMSGADVHRLLEGQVGGLLGPAGTDQIREMLQHAQQPDMNRGVAALVGAGALLFGAGGAFIELQNALNRVWEVAPDPERGGLRRFLTQRVMSFGMLLTIAFLLLVSLLLSALLSAFGDGLDALLPEPLSGAVLQAINAAVSFAVITLLFALLFRHLPDARVEWRDVWAGAVATALLFTAGKFGLGLYLGRSDPGSAFGAAGALALLLIWIYYSAIIVLLGAEFTQAWARERGAGIRPASGAVRIIERTEHVRGSRASRPDPTGEADRTATPRLRQDAALQQGGSDDGKRSGGSGDGTAGGRSGGGSAGGDSERSAD